MRIKRSELEAMVQNWTDTELHNALHAGPSELSQEAEEVARLEFNRRGLTAEQLIHSQEEKRSAQQQKSTHLSWGMRAAAIWLSPILLFCPTLLVWRRFYERGEPQKAKDWARWSWYGAAFYGVLIALRVLSP